MHASLSWDPEPRVSAPSSGTTLESARTDVNGALYTVDNPYRGYTLASITGKEQEDLAAPDAILLPDTP